MEYSERHLILASQFSLGAEKLLPESEVSVCFYSFHSKSAYFPYGLYDNLITENSSFSYPVFVPPAKQRKAGAIVLLHGLNERKWDKYLTWAESLCERTGKAVILFPIAFHMNRSPYSWSNPREMSDVMTLRRRRNGEDRFLSFANVALSERISENPYRFYASGRQTLSDLSELFTMIKKGNHPLFEKDTQIDIFAYSIGAFLSQIALLTNQDNLFADSKLFMLCGGSIFNSMFGKSRNILDGAAFDKLLSYYVDEFMLDIPAANRSDMATNAFCSMISPETNREKRISFFEKQANRIKGISLKKDTVIPYEGVIGAMGQSFTSSQIELLDFGYDYSHENPFPTTGKVNHMAVNQSFDYVFGEASAFLS